LLLNNVSILMFGKEFKIILYTSSLETLQMLDLNFFGFFITIVCDQYFMLSSISFSTHMRMSTTTTR